MCKGSPFVHTKCIRMHEKWKCKPLIRASLQPIALMHYENAANEACETLTFSDGQKRTFSSVDVCPWHFDKRNMPAHIINGNDTKKPPTMRIENKSR